MSTTSKKSAETKGGLKKLLINDFFVPNKASGLREGFRRLSLLAGGIGFVWTYTNAQILSDYVSLLSGSLGMGMDIAGGLMAVVAFFAVAYITKTVGWVLEGFIKK